MLHKSLVIILRYVEVAHLAAHLMILCVQRIFITIIFILLVQFLMNLIALCVLSIPLVVGFKCISNFDEGQGVRFHLAIGVSLIHLDWLKPG